jgi:hypothetical protein
MATQICPVCKKDVFTWSMQDHEPSEPETMWGCNICGFYAYENERYNSDGTYRYESMTCGCTSCGSTQDIKLHKDGKEYLWCSSCHLLTEQPLAVGQ